MDAALPLQRGRVVADEDDDRVRHVSVDALRELGYTVVQASDGNQALAVLAVQPEVGLLFTDVVMSGISGRHLACHMKNDYVVPPRAVRLSNANSRQRTAAYFNRTIFCRRH